MLFFNVSITPPGHASQGPFMTLGHAIRFPSSSQVTAILYTFFNRRENSRDLSSLIPNDNVFEKCYIFN